MAKISCQGRFANRPCFSQGRHKASPYISSVLTFPFPQKRPKRDFFFSSSFFPLPVSPAAGV